MNQTSIFRRQLPYEFHNITLYLIITNLIVFMLMQLIKAPVLRIAEGAVGIDSFLSMVPLLVNKGFVWQFFTYMFAHASVQHLFFNMLGLFIFGSQVEQEMGSWEFLLFYLVTGFFAGVLSYLIYLASGLTFVHLLGASGALYAVMLAFATYYPNARIFVMGIIPMRSVSLIIFYAIIALYSQMTGRNGGVAHMTHLGGFLFAYLYFLIRLGRNPIQIWRNSR